MIKIVSFFLLSLCFSYAQKKVEDYPKKVQIVFEYILKEDYPELIKKNSYQIRPVRYSIFDIDQDGNEEVFLQTFTHYKQSPSIRIYSVNDLNEVQLFIEGLAPGFLEKNNPEQDYFDTHSTGSAVDLTLGERTPEKIKGFTKSSINNGFSTIIFNDFIHNDKRESSEFYLDLSYLKTIDGSKSCKSFQFAFPDDIIAGKINEGNYFIAKVKNNLFVYQISKISDKGFLEKKVEIIDCPEDFKKFISGEKKEIKYESSNGEIKIIELE